ncbi:MAG: hypothetical protein V8S86_12140 [Eubacteriales bacterium]
MTYDDQQVLAADFTRRPGVCQTVSSRDPAFTVLPSSTLEFDGQFNGGGETIFTEINLNEDHTIDDMFCTCGAGSLCVHLAAMMYDMVERDTIRLSELENK